jgi:hypothetical protein
MRNSHATTLALGFAVLAALPLSAQAPITNVHATFGSGNVPPDPGVITSGPTGGSYYVGPYSGTITIGSTTNNVIFNCVDFFHDVSNSETWTATLVNLGSGTGVGTTDANSLTRLYGNISVSSQTFSALDVYRAAAYLVSTYSSQPSQHQGATIGIQDEIWEMTSLFYPQLGGEHSDFQALDTTPGTSDSHGTTRTDGYSFSAPKTLADLANDIYAYAHESAFDYGAYWVVTSSDPNSDVASSPQEFLIRQTTSTPEPGTFVLLASGMVGVFGGGFARRRRARKSAVELSQAV